MSYSFNVRGPTRGDVMDKINEHFDKVVAAQPLHQADRELAVSTANYFVNLIPETVDRDYSVSVNGSLMTNGAELVSVSIGVHVGLISPEF